MRRSVLKLAFVAAATVLVAGCAATGIKHSEMAASMPKLKAGEGRIYFFRPSSMIGAALQPEVRLNGRVVGQSKPGGFFFVDRPAGSYVAATATETEKSVSFALQAGETKYVRTYMSMGVALWRANLELVDANKANAELDSLAYTGKVAGK